MRRWLDRCEPRFVGLVGSAAELQQAYAAFGVNPTVVLEAHGAEQVEHAADLVAIGTDNDPVLSYDPDSTPADYRHDLPLLVAGRTPAPPTAAELLETGAAGRGGLVEVFKRPARAGHRRSPTPAGDRPEKRRYRGRDHRCRRAGRHARVPPPAQPAHVVLRLPPGTPVTLGADAPSSSTHPGCRAASSSR